MRSKCQGTTKPGINLSSHCFLWEFLPTGSPLDLHLKVLPLFQLVLGENVPFKEKPPVPKTRGEEQGQGVPPKPLAVAPHEHFFHKGV